MNTGEMPRRVVVGISGSTGSIYGIRLLQVLQAMPDVESHVIISPAAKRTLVHETEFSVTQVEALADVLYDYRDIGAALASGSFRTFGMIIAPSATNHFYWNVFSLPAGLLGISPRSLRYLIQKHGLGEGRDKE